MIEWNNGPQTLATVSSIIEWNGLVLGVIPPVVSSSIVGESNLRVGSICTSVIGLDSVAVGGSHIG